MNLDKILAISGKPGLYQLQVQTRTGFLVLSLIDGKKTSIGLKNNVSLLSDIAVYTQTEEKPLKDVFEAIRLKENGGATSVSYKAGREELRNYFTEVLPDHDTDRVFDKDIRKIIQWYNLLLDKGFINQEE